MKVMEDLTDITNHYGINSLFTDEGVTFKHNKKAIEKFYKEYIEPLNEIAIVEIQKAWDKSNEN